METKVRPLAVVTGASGDIGREVALLAAREGFDLIVIADQSMIDVTAELRELGANVDIVQTDLATSHGVEELYRAASERPIAALLINVEHADPHGFLDRELLEVRQAIDANITGTLDLLHKVGRQMRARGQGRILITTWSAHRAPDGFPAIYNATNTFIYAFARGLCNELKGTGVTVTCLTPDTSIAQSSQRTASRDFSFNRPSHAFDPAAAAQAVFQVMMQGADESVKSSRRLTTTVDKVSPALLAERANIRWPLVY